MSQQVESPTSSDHSSPDPNRARWSFSQRRGSGGELGFSAQSYSANRASPALNTGGNFLLSPPLLNTTSSRLYPASARYSPLGTAGTFSDTSDGIRDSTTLLSDMLLPPAAASHHPSSFGPSSHHAIPPRPAPRFSPSNGSPSSDYNFISSPPPGPSPFETRPALFGRSNTIRAQDYAAAGTDSTSKTISPTGAGRSALTLLLARDKGGSGSTPPTPRAGASGSSPSSDSQSGESTPRVQPSSYADSSNVGTGNGEQDRERDSGRPNKRAPDVEQGLSLLGSVPALNYGSTVASSPPNDAYASLSVEAHKPSVASRVKIQMTSYLTPKAVGKGVILTFEALPAVLLGLLLNVLDGVSYGFIMFPAGAIFVGFGGLGVSMFFVTTIVSQLVYTLGGSSFPGATSSMIIEVIPFFHIMVEGIIQHVGEDDPMRIIATTMVAFAFSSILTGLAFTFLGLFKLGSIIEFFPRHILVGCIGGVGVFLIQTGLNVSAGLADEEADLTWRLIKMYFASTHVLALWVPAFILAVLLRVITSKYHHQLIFPLYFVALPILFYAIVFIFGFDIDELREYGWIFDVGDSREPWYKFYSYFDFRNTSYGAIWATMPTQLALLFFNVLHPPLNVPALGVSLGKDDVDLNLELTGHGVSNLLAGFIGAPSNYLAYVNTLLFNRVGGTTRYSGFLLALATIALLLVGTGPIAFIPVLEVGALIFVLGIDLVKEAVWDTRRRASTSEYITILGIILVMSVYDFVAGVLFGIILASLFFVLQNSRGSAIRSSFTGAFASSTVRRPSAHRQYLREVGRQTCIMRLQGHLFFGTISRVEDACRKILDKAAWEHNPIRFLVLDISLVGGLDLSAAEGFVRMQRLLLAKSVILVFCGQPADSAVAKALQAVGIWAGHVEVFSNLNEALEWTENAYLRAWYTSPTQKLENGPAREIPLPGARDTAPFALGESFANSPRRSHLHHVGERVMHATAHVRRETLEHKEQPFNTLIKAFSSYTELDDDFLRRLAPYFTPLPMQAGDVLFRQGDTADALYIIENGVVRAIYAFADHISDVEESCVAGTLAGELSALSGEPRNATVVAERQSVLWKLSSRNLVRMEEEHPQDARLFIKLVLKTSKTDYDVLLASLAARQ